MIFLYVWIALQIIVEMLPFSSSGHLLLFETFIKKYFSVNMTRLFAAQHISIQDVYYFLHWPTLLIVLYYFGPRWYSFFFINNQLQIKPIVWVISADVIIAVFYMIKKRIVIPFSLGAGFIITALCLFSTYWCAGIKLLEWHFSDAIILGVAQSVALLPGVSRLALTCAVGCMLGFSVLDSLYLSWLIQMPLMIAACIKSTGDLMNAGRLRQLLKPPIGLVMLGSGGISLWTLYLVVTVIQKGFFYLLGIYMLLPLFFWIWLAKYLKKEQENV